MVNRVSALHRLRSSTDALWGYDVFIAHRTEDAAPYAFALFEALSNERMSCFIDKVAYGPGDSLRVATRVHVSKSTLFLLLGSPKLLSVRQPEDWIEQELHTFLAPSRTDPKVLVGDFGSTVESALQPRLPHVAAREWIGLLRPYLRLPQQIDALSEPPTEEVIDAIRRQLRGRRRDRTRLFFFEGMAAVLLVLLAASAYFGISSELQRRQTEGRRLLADIRSSTTAAATQLDAPRARAAMDLADTAESRSVASELLGTLLAPIRVIRPLQSDGGALSGAWMSDGRLLMSTGLQTYVTASKRGSPIHSIPEGVACRESAYSLNGELRACLLDGRLTIASVPDGEVKAVLNINGLKEEAKLAFDPTAKVVIVVDSRQIFRLPLHAGTMSSVPLPGSGWPPLLLAVSPDGASVTLLPSSADVGAPWPIVEVELPSGRHRTLAQVAGDVRALARSSDAAVVASASQGGQIRVSFLGTEQRDLAIRGLADASALALSRDGRFVAVAADGGIQVHSTRTGELVARASIAGMVRHLTFDAAARRLLAAGAEQGGNTSVAVTWNLLASADYLMEFVRGRESPFTLGFSASGNLVEYGYDGLRSIDLFTGTVEPLSPLPDFDVNAILPTNGSATAQRGAVLLAREISGNEHRLLDIQGKRVGPDVPASTIAAATDKASFAALFVAAADPSDAAPKRVGSIVHVWQSGWPKPLAFPVDESARAVLMDPSGRYVVVLFEQGPSTPSRVAVYDALTLQQLATFNTGSAGTTAAISSDGRRLALADGEQLQLLRLPSLELERSVRLMGTVKALVASQSAPRFALADTAGLVSVLDSAGKILVQRKIAYAPHQRRGLAFSQDNRWLAVLTSPGNDGVVRLVPADPTAFHDELCARQLEEPNPDAWNALLPNDSAPAACSSAGMSPR